MAKFLYDADSEFLYARIASRIEQQIKQDLLMAGDKLPSLRALSQEQAISLSTAFKAYVELENMGLIEARPKSGYYVKFTRARLSKVPETSVPTKKIEQASVTEMIAMVYRNMSEATVLRTITLRLRH
jgi:DNA-binding GntR family transcriptional regulator